ncbi:MAG: DUF1054 family protein [Firmicutes bacterium]|nr:DUF1054 family protein [Bacillota bacterium]
MLEKDSTQFITSRDLEIFTIPTFAERMTEIRSRVSPKLELLGERLTEAIAKETGEIVHYHVAKHARRTVNPPDETWVALSPSARGYKGYAHIAVGVGYFGSFVKLIAKAESKEKVALARAIMEFGSPKTIWLTKGDNLVEASLERVQEVLEKKSYGVETGTVIEDVPGPTSDRWFDWSMQEIAAIWSLYEFVRKKV